LLILIGSAVHAVPKDLDYVVAIVDDDVIYDRTRQSPGVRP
jgi:hypothetical protein